MSELDSNRMTQTEDDGWRAQALQAEARLRERGLDLARWFDIEQANQSLEAGLHFPASAGVGVIIGNSRALWRPFDRWRAARPRSGDPLDEYVESCVGEALAALSPTWVAFSHHLLPRPIPIQRYAQVSGLAQMSPSGLAIHHRFGPWIALRAVAVFEGRMLPKLQGKHPHPCSTCAAPCLAPFEAAMNTEPRLARNFLPVRTSCPVGSEHRYDAAQIEYHYMLGVPPTPDD